ncbi:hypothetical protein F3K20_20450 [Streptomyces scabiei]|nr:hypothetical protein [Streptomyces sp. LBUM 1484]MBP5876633.1 hypothetical protein [Streptomyces sp. LBUM 1477]MBP5884388.1 hypothetical protein [Streptomyces sp. LBUM 1487]MBP5900408.1 hypothetical protein [Streptomyces sp. LBUM 1488]QTU46895.1 hypothetical protein F3K20_20450 [Streptomyces sp. LBUM 1482]QTU62811.1 hypothetical protein F3K22_18905 [Streptomyces sp. LBUM 1475]
MKTLSEMTERECFARVGRRPGMFAGKTSVPMLTLEMTHRWSRPRRGAPSQRPDNGCRAPRAPMGFRGSCRPRRLPRPPSPASAPVAG